MLLSKQMHETEVHLSKLLISVIRIILLAVFTLINKQEKRYNVNVDVPMLIKN